MKLPFTLDKGVASTAALGLIVLETDETIEAEFRTLFNQTGIGLFHARIPVAQEITPETLPKMEAALPAAVGLLPSAFPMDVVGYACTSGATVIGADNISRIVTQTFPNAKTTDPITAVMAALQHLGIRRIGLVTPYVEDVSAAMINLLRSNSFEVVHFGSFEQKDDATVARISPDSIYNAICDIGVNDDVEAVFVSCTNLRTFDVIERAETLIEKPVISSNQALAWHMAELAKLSGVIAGPGSLFTERGLNRNFSTI
ncbi:Asp/Glu racemase [Rhodobacterales bacterium 52_120_T64]|nr:Asp/Glu racemase [Rhodobacterales bacterium 52_120_T64]